MRLAVVLLVGLTWLSSLLGLACGDTGTSQLQQILEKLDRDREASGGPAQATSVLFDIYKQAVKDHDAGPYEREFWDVVSGTSGQKWLVYEDYFNANGKKGPIFLLIGAEAPLSSSDIDQSSFINYAASLYGALVVALEHRYYGESRPTQNFEDDPTLFSSDQALADVNTFIPYLKKEYNLDPDTPVIVFGYSYGGNLAAWFKQDYPHSAVGAISSSAPIRAKVDFFQYLEVVGEALANSFCNASVKKGIDEYANKLRNGQFSEINNALGSSIDSYEKGAWKAQNCFINPLKTIVQYSGTGSGSVIKFCSEFDLRVSQSGSEFGAVLSTMAEVRNKGAMPLHVQITRHLGLAFLPSPTFPTPNQTNPKNCVAASANNLLSENRLWNFQYCNEFGYLQTATSAQQPFATFADVLNVTAFYQRSCINSFPALMGDTTWPDAAGTNMKHGGLDFHAENVTFVHGSMDPWHTLGVAQDAFFSEKIKVRYIEGGSHCNDAFAPDSASSAARKVQSQIILDIQQYLEGTPWAHHSADTSTSQASVSRTNAQWAGQQDACAFDIVMKKTKATVKYGDQIKLAFTVRSRALPGSDNLFVGIEHWESDIYFVKSSVVPPANRTSKVPDIEHDGAIFWENVPTRRSRTFKASFISGKKGVVEFHPGACLQDGINKSCCKYETIRVKVVDP